MFSMISDIKVLTKCIEILTNPDFEEITKEKGFRFMKSMDGSLTYLESYYTCITVSKNNPNIPAFCTACCVLYPDGTLYMPDSDMTIDLKTYGKFISRDDSFSLSTLLNPVDLKYFRLVCSVKDKLQGTKFTLHYSTFEKIKRDLDTFFNSTSMYKNYK